MTHADRVFEKFAPFIKDYIHSHGWNELRAVQLAAADVIFNTDKNLLLTSETASGKTEAAFFPIISELFENPGPLGIKVLYVAPLKSLINDQYGRLGELLDEAGISVTHWHGDVASSHKKKLLDSPDGILQITPESLEAMLMRRPNDIVRLFSALRYVVIDEIHTLISSDRGNQVICQLCRIASLTGRSARRIGLSATVGDERAAAEWLGGGSGRETTVPSLEAEKRKMMIGVEHFYIGNTSSEQSVRPTEHTEENIHAHIDAGYEFIYDSVREVKSLVFSNSREETEYITATLRQIADIRKEKDRFLIHHGNLSAAIREEAEAKMKDDEVDCVTCATVTMELGIDIGRLERIVQNDAPNTVSSFLQRLGRSGRRGQAPQILTVLREEDPIPNTPLPQLIPWNLLRAIAIIQLYAEERFVEPPYVKKRPFSLLLHQMLSIVFSSGEMKPRRLAEKLLSLPPFAYVSAEELRTLMLYAVKNDLLQLTDEGGLIVGLAGERITNSFKFFAVFKDSEDYTVRHDSDEIGTITTPPPVGDRFALAGRVWEVTELDIPRRLVFVKSVLGKMQVSWPGDYGEIHTRILERMRRVLEEDTVYPYLMPNARVRLEDARRLVRATGALEKSVVSLGGCSYCIFPWLGTKAFRTYRRLLMRLSSVFAISDIEFEGCYYISFRMEKGSPGELLSELLRLAESSISSDALVRPSEAPVFEKYDSFVPAELLRSAYACDKLDIDTAKRRIIQEAQR